MKIALFSDIHANLPALEACLKCIEDHQPDAVYCLGDLVGYHIWANEVVNEIRKRFIPTIAGNYDEAIALMSKDEAYLQTALEGNDAGKISKAFTSSIINEEERHYLKTLPAHIKVEFHLSGNKLNLLLVHGSPRKINEYLFENCEETYLLELMKESDADILCFGHTHQPFHKIVPETVSDQQHFRHAINIGSVGKPKDGNPKGCFVLLHIDEDASVLRSESVRVEFVRFDYNVELAAKAIEHSVLPNQFAEMLRRGA